MLEMSKSKHNHNAVLPEWYKLFYEDAAASPLSAEEHYRLIGKKKHYFPNPKKLMKNIWKTTPFPLKSFINFYASKLKLPGFKHPDYLSITLIIKNEAPYMEEWLNYHIGLGVTKFYIYNNESTDNLKEVLKPFIDQGYVVLEDIKGKLRQNPAYNAALARHRFDTHWMGLLDADEFLVPLKHDNLCDFLKDYEKYSALGINWVMYDGNGHLKKPEGLVTENFLTVHGNPHPKNLHIKSIVNPRKVKVCGSPHYCDFKSGNTVDENGNPIKGAFSEQHHSDKIRINHYFSKSLEEFEAKISRGRAASSGKYEIRREEFEFADAVKDTSILKFIPNLKKRMRQSA